MIQTLTYYKHRRTNAGQITPEQKVGNNYFRGGVPRVLFILSDASLRPRSQSHNGCDISSLTIAFSNKG